MNFIELHYSIEYYFATTELHEKDCLEYFKRCTKKNEIRTIASKIVKVLKEKDVLRRFKALILLHTLSQLEESTIFSQIESFGNEKMDAEFLVQSTKLVYWEHIYDEILLTEESLRRKYEFLNGSFAINRGEVIPQQFRTPRFCEDFEKDVLYLFGIINDFVMQKIKSGAENSYLQKACELCIKDMVCLYELVLNLDNYKSLLNESILNTERASSCQKQRLFIKTEMKKKNEDKGQLNRIPQITEYKKSVTKFSSFIKKFPLASKGIKYDSSRLGDDETAGIVNILLLN
uniref:AP180 N-terminal homology (ANTH) domain-containing protein n=1 Tax=Entamoeba invadens TaxID=33085 RepID=S0B3B0_ENTIV|nr:hypothetical protein [Entamoeba invadens]